MASTTVGVAAADASAARAEDRIWLTALPSSERRIGLSSPSCAIIAFACCTVASISRVYSSPSSIGRPAYWRASPRMRRSRAESSDCCAETAVVGGGGGGEGGRTDAKQLLARIRLSTTRLVKAHAERYSEWVAPAFSRRASTPKNWAVGIGVHGSAPS